MSGVPACNRSWSAGRVGPARSASATAHKFSSPSRVTGGRAGLGRAHGRDVQFAIHMVFKSSFEGGPRATACQPGTPRTSLDRLHLLFLETRPSYFQCQAPVPWVGRTSPGGSHIRDLALLSNHVLLLILIKPSTARLFLAKFTGECTNAFPQQASLAAAALACVLGQGEQIGGSAGGIDQMYTRDHRRHVALGAVGSGLLPPPRALGLWAMLQSLCQDALLFSLLTMLEVCLPPPPVPRPLQRIPT